MNKAVNIILIPLFFLILFFNHSSPVAAQTVISSKNPVGPALQLTPLKIDLGNIESNTSKDFSISIKNTGKKELNWEITTAEPWIISKDDISIKKKASYSYETWKTQEEHLPETLSARETRKIHFTADTTDLPEGEYEGSILVRSNGGEEKVTVTMKVVSLKSMSINPISIKVRVGQRRTFRAVGVWSDGSRTDLSGHADGEWTMSDPSIGSFSYKKPVFLAKKTGQVEIKKTRGDITSNTALIDVEEFILEPVLFVSPREIDLGAIGPGESSRGVFSLKNVGSKTLMWSTDGPHEWVYADEKTLSGILMRSPRYIHINVESSFEGAKEYVSRPGKVYPLTITIGTMQDAVTYKKALLPGSYREMIKLNSNGGARHVFINFEVTAAGARPRLAVEPPGIDLGIVESGKRLVKKIKVSNAGEDILKWKARLQGNKRIFSGIALKRGRYISLFNKHISNREIYRVPEHLKDSVFISGKWLEDKGYPSSIGDNSGLKKTFFGTGIVVFVWKDVEGGILNAFIDNRFVGKIDCNSEKRERAEFIIAEDLEEGPHILNMVCEKGSVVIEGMRIYGDSLTKGQNGWIRIYPGLGTTSKETDYVNVMINSGILKPGNYSENILFTSNGGSKIVEASIEVLDAKHSNIIDIYSYIKGLDCLFTANPESENPVVLKDYENRGVAFRLFRKGTQGTTEFYMWYNFSKGDHFYSYDRNGGGTSLKGYRFEGSIGNIATSRLSKTKELYRWHNPLKGTHFYSTDLKWKGQADKGYKYDGIAGYVR